MTIQTKVSNVGVVDVVKIEAEIFPTPMKYNLDCTECGWGYFSLNDQVTAEMEAQAHLDRNHQLYDEYDDVIDGTDL